jgi:WD40 repeat protein
VALSHKDRHFLSAGGDGWVTEWDMDHPETGRVVVNVESQVFSLAISPPEWPEQCILAGNMLGGLHWVDRNDPSRTRNILHHDKGLFDILWIGNEVFTGGGDGAITRWDATRKKPVESFQLSNRSVRALAYSPHHHLMAAGAGDGNIYLLDSKDFTLVNTIAAHDNSVFALAWSPDGERLLSGGRDAHLKVWDIAGNNLSSQPAHWFTINHITFSPDGTHFATASRDKTIKIWQSDTLELVKVLETIRDHGHVNSVNRLLWTDDYLISCSDDRTALMFSNVS